MIKHFFLAILLGIISLLVYVAYHVGYFKPVTIQEVGPKAFILIGVKHEGAYHKIVEKIQLVETKVKSLGGSCAESFGLYLDDPVQVEQERLKSFGGCVVQDSNWMNANLHELKDFQIVAWKAQGFIQAYFEGSPGVGPFKVYPKVSNFIRAKQLETQASVLEKYQMQPDNKMVTYYYFPVSGLESTLF